MRNLLMVLAMVAGPSAAAAQRPVASAIVPHLVRVDGGSPVRGPPRPRPAAGPPMGGSAQRIALLPEFRNMTSTAEPLVLNQNILTVPHRGELEAVGSIRFNAEGFLMDGAGGPSATYRSDIEIRLEAQTGYTYVMELEVKPMLANGARTAGRLLVGMHGGTASLNMQANEQFATLVFAVPSAGKYLFTLSLEGSSRWLFRGARITTLQ
jgi:hypothetical protein